MTNTKELLNKLTSRNLEEGTKILEETGFTNVDGSMTIYDCFNNEINGVEDAYRIGSYARILEDYNFSDADYETTISYTVETILDITSETVISKKWELIE